MTSTYSHSALGDRQHSIKRAPSSESLHQGHLAGGAEWEGGNQSKASTGARHVRYFPLVQNLKGCQKLSHQDKDFNAIVKKNPNTKKLIMNKWQNFKERQD